MTSKFASSLRRNLEDLVERSSDDDFLPADRPAPVELPGDMSLPEAFRLGQFLGARYGVGYMAGAVDLLLHPETDR